jgi:1,4-alpha-glucan branching enzyme
MWPPPAGVLEGWYLDSMRNRARSILATASITLSALLSLAAASCGDASQGAYSPPPLDDASSPTGDATILSDASDAGDASRSDAPDAVDAAPIPAPFLGGNVEPGGVVFRVWAPNATAASVDGDFTPSDVSMTSIDGGVFEAHVAGAHAGDGYHFALTTPDGMLTRTDPYCRELSGTTCKVVDPNAYAWSTAAFTRPSRAAAVVYELHLGSFSVAAGATNGTFASTRDALAGLADLGVTVVELMPVQSFGGDATGWGYNPQLYDAPMPDLGTSDDFRALVDRAHSLGIAVWIDTVVNHMDGWSEAPLRCFDGDCPDASAGVYFFPAGPYATTPWGPRPDYATPEVATMLTASVDTWMVELRADGFRWDSVSNIRALDGQGTTPGGQALLVAANERTHALDGLSVAEDLKGYGAITQTPASGGFGFDAQWDGFGYTMTSVLDAANDADRDLGQVVGALQGTSGGDPFARLLFLEDHDTVGNGGARLPALVDSANPTSLFARKRSMLGAVVMMTTPGVPMIFMGEEALATAPFANPAPPLAAPTAEGLLGRALYKDMIRLRRNLDGMAGGLADTQVEIVQQNDAAKVLAYRRYGASGEDVLVVANFANKAYTEYDVGVPDANAWRVRVNSDLPTYGSDFTGTQTGSVTPVVRATDGQAYALPLVLGAYSAMVLTR